MNAGNPNVTGPSFRLSILFIVTGIVFFLAFHVLSLLTLAGWIGDYPRNPRGWTQAHLLVLGWGTLIAMGAVYQLINVVLQKKIFSVGLGYVQYAFTAIGVTGLLIGFYTARLQIVAGFAVLAFVGLLLFVFNLTVTLIQARKWDPITVSTQFAVAYLFLTALIGMLMGLDFVWNDLGSMHERLFGAHLWLGAFGWFGMLITGFSYKLLPMFYLAHEYPTRLQTYVLILWNFGVLLGAAAFVFGTPLVAVFIAWLAIAAALIVYAVHAFQIRKHRHKANPGSGVMMSVYAAVGAAALFVGMALYALLFSKSGLGARTFTFAGWMYLGGWVGLTVLGYMSKIVPFLWWTRKYGGLIGKRKVPRLADMIPDKLVRNLLLGLGVSILVILIGIGTDAGAAIRVGGIALSVLSIVYIGLIVRVFAK